MAKLMGSDELIFLKISKLYKEISDIDHDFDMCKKGSDETVEHLLNTSDNLTGLRMPKKLRLQMLDHLKSKKTKCKKELALAIKKVKGSK